MRLHRLEVSDFLVVKHPKVLVGQVFLALAFLVGGENKPKQHSRRHDHISSHYWLCLRLIPGNLHREVVTQGKAC